MVKFNIGKFNLKSASSTSITSTSQIQIDARCKEILVKTYIIEKQKSQVSVNSIVLSYTNIIDRCSDDETLLSLTAELTPSVFVFSDKVSDEEKTKISINAEAISALLGEGYIELKNVNLKPNEEIEINMCDLTVTKQGENAIHLLTSDGDFFDFLIGENNVLVEGAYQAEVDIYWKDKWL